MVTILGATVDALDLAARAVLGATANGDAASPAGPAPANFQPYIFWAYGMVCALLGGFWMLSAWQSRGLRERLRHLEERFRRAHPETGASPENEEAGKAS